MASVVLGTLSFPKNLGTISLVRALPRKLPPPPCRGSFREEAQAILRPVGSSLSKQLAATSPDLRGLPPPAGEKQQ